jgi:hypothetical protein
MREDRIGIFLQDSIVAPLVDIAFGVRRRQGLHLRYDGIHVVAHRRRLVAEQLVDADDELGDRTEPRELRIVEQRVQQIIARLAPVYPLVSRALPVQEGFMQAQKSLAKIVEQFFRLLNFRDIVIGHRRPISHYA